MSRELHKVDLEFAYRFLADELHALGYRVSARRVWRLCRVAVIRAATTKRRGRYRKALSPVHDDLVQRNFTATRPNECWLTDITEHLTGREGKLYLCAVKDVWSSMIVDYAIDNQMKVSLAVRALENAVVQRGNPTNVVVHRDRGPQFGSKKYRRALKHHRVRESTARVGTAGDNAAMEWFSLLQKNVLERQSWGTPRELRLTIVACLEGKYHCKRRQRGLGNLTPVDFEAIMIEAVRLAA